MAFGLPPCLRYGEHEACSLGILRAYRESLAGHTIGLAAGVDGLTSAALQSIALVQAATDQGTRQRCTPPAMLTSRCPMMGGRHIQNAAEGPTSHSAGHHPVIGKHGPIERTRQRAGPKTRDFTG